VSREAGHTRDAGWQIGVSKTVDHSVADAWSFITSPAGIAIWLGDGVTALPSRGEGYEATDGVRGETRGFRERDRVRLTWRPPDWARETTPPLTVRSAPGGRAMPRVHQERLADATERERQRRHWQEVVNAIVAAL
jgi:uncharacterized protein YndB with AHSA1/START domain